MTIDCCFNWPEIHRIAGQCLKPGGSLLTERALEVGGIRGLLPEFRVADIGCGAGETLEYLERSGVYSSVGLDYSETLLGEAIPRLVSGRLVRGRADSLPFRKGSFDALFCECVLSILEDRITPLREFARVLKEGGFLIVSDVFGRGDSGQEEVRTKPEVLRNERLLSKEDLLDLLTGLGFSLLLWEEHERLLKEFAARMILAGLRLPDIWACRRGQEGKGLGRARLSYFLMVARKAEVASRPVEHKKAGT